jgi:hypothetical protein
MAETEEMDMRNAKVQMLAHGAAAARDSMDFDPIYLPTVTLRDLGCLVATDYPDLVRLVDQMAEASAEFQVVDYLLVWSDDQTQVRAICPRCGNVDNVSDVFLGTPDGKILVCNDCT